MKFISLIDITTQNIITIDAEALTFRLETDGYIRETRLIPYHGDILYALFNKHPLMLSYEEIKALLKNHGLIISDLTRLHRKLSEIRSFLSSFHLSLKDIILNIRGIGYSLPLRLKNLYSLEQDQTLSFKNPNLTKHILIIKELIDEVIALIAKNKVIRYQHWYIINRDLVRDIIIAKIALFNESMKVILEQTHEADFLGLRLQYLLTKLKTYIGLARISEYPISEAQWLDWFKQEVWLVFEDFKKLLKFLDSN